jgi:hypothetical protein
MLKLDVAFVVPGEGWWWGCAAWGWWCWCLWRHVLLVCEVAYVHLICCECTHNMLWIHTGHVATLIFFACRKFVFPLDFRCCIGDVDNDLRVSKIWKLYLWVSKKYDFFSICNNDLSHKPTKFQFQILCIFVYTKMTNVWIPICTFLKKNQFLLHFDIFV